MFFTYKCLAKFKILYSKVLFSGFLTAINSYIELARRIPGDHARKSAFLVRRKFIFRNRSAIPLVEACRRAAEFVLASGVQLLLREADARRD